MNSCLRTSFAAGTCRCRISLAIRPRPPVILLFRDRQSCNLNHLILIFPLWRAARGRGAKGPFSDPPGLTQSDAARLLQIRCKSAAPKTKKPRICATNRENLLQVLCRFSKRARQNQGFRGFRPAAFGCQQHEQQGAKFALRRRCLLLDFASTADPRRISR
jgi:hypothetical protein